MIDTIEVLLLYGRHICVPPRGTSIQITPPNNARMKKRKDLNLGEVVYITIIYRVSDF